MHVSTARRLAGIATAAAFVVLPLAVQPIVVSASSSGTLYAISGNQDKLDTVDSSTGTLTQLSDLSVAGADAQTAGMAGDPVTHRIYAIRTVVTFTSTGINFEIQLLTINAVNGAILAKPDVSGSPLQSLVFDPTTSTLYGFNGAKVLRLDPATGAQTTLATVADPSVSTGVFSMTIAPAAHTIYVADDEAFAVDGNSFTQVTAVDTRTGALTVGPHLSQLVRSVVYDEGSGSLDGVTDCCPINAVSINPATGAVNVLATVGDSNTIQPYWLTEVAVADSFVLDAATFDSLSGVETDTLFSVNDQTGAATPSAALAQPVASLLFMPSVTITSETLTTDVKSAFAGGLITSAGVENALLSQLGAAGDARSRSQCAVASNDYQAFISTVQAQSGKTIAAASAGRLVGEAQYLQANCP